MQTGTETTCSSLTPWLLYYYTTTMVAILRNMFAALLEKLYIGIADGMPPAWIFDIAVLN